MNLLGMKQQDYQITDSVPAHPGPHFCLLRPRHLAILGTPPWKESPVLSSILRCLLVSIAPRGCCALGGMFLSGGVFERDFARCHSKEGEDYLGVSSSPSWQGRHGGSG